MLGNLFWVVGTTFSMLAGMVAFLISYNEHQHRFHGWRLWKETLTVGGLTLLFFLFISWMLATFLPGLL